MSVLRNFFRSSANRFRNRNYGCRIYANPNTVTHDSYFPTENLYWLESRFFWRGDWDRPAASILERPDVQFTISRFVGGATWEETGSFEHMRNFIVRNGSFDGWSADQTSIETRHQALDQIWADLQAEGRLKTRAELDPNAEGEVGGILVFLGREGQLYFGGAGQHRLTMAQLLNFDEIPLWLGGVHWSLKARWRELVAFEPSW